MPSRLEKLFPASFRGVEFSVRGESLTSGGRKIIMHEYLDSDQRFVEDQGQIPPVFSLTAFVSGSDWREKSFAIEAEINKAGIGELIMPTFGSVNVHAMPYTKDASQSSIGEITLQLSFATGKPSTAPSVSTPTIQEVFDSGDKARTALVEEFTETYKAPNFIQNALAAIGDARASVDAVVEKFATSIDLDQITDFAKQATDFYNQAASFIADPEGYALNIIQTTSLGAGIFQLSSLGFGVSGAVDAVLNLSEFGAELLESESSITVTGSAVTSSDIDETASNTPYWPEDTEERIQRNESRRFVVRTVRINTLIIAYEQLAAGEYKTTEEIITLRNKVEAVYSDIMLTGTTDPTAIQSFSAIRTTVDEIRRLSLAVLAQKEQEVFGLTEIDQGAGISQFALAYNLYAEEFLTAETLTERANVIRNLNPSKNGMELVNNLTVLESEGL